MSLAEYVDIDELMKNSVITLKYRHLVCSVCGRQRPQSERIMDIEEELASFPGLTLFDLDHLRISKLQGQLEAFEEVRDYIKGEMK